MIPESTIELPELVVSCTLDDDTVAVGGRLHGTARLTNRGPERMTFVAGPALGGIVDRSRSSLLGDVVGWITPAGVEVDLARGGESELNLVIGTTPRDPDGAVLPGRYATVVRVPVTFLDHDGTPAAHHLLVRGGPSVTVVAHAD